MASDWPNDPGSVLRGLFGSLQAGAEGGRDAATMWQSLREGAYSWAAGHLNITSATVPTEAEIQAKAQELIGHVTIMDMNKAVAQVGEWMRAKQNLQQLSPTDQIDAKAIWVPKWNDTADNPAIPTRYRIRVLRSISYRGIGTGAEKWAEYEITSPLTNINDALDQANTLFSRANYNRSASINAILDYEIIAI